MCHSQIDSMSYWVTSNSAIIPNKLICSCNLARLLEVYECYGVVSPLKRPFGSLFQPWALGLWRGIEVAQISSSSPKEGSWDETDKFCLFFSTLPWALHIFAFLKYFYFSPFWNSEKRIRIIFIATKYFLSTMMQEQQQQRRPWVIFRLILRHYGVIFRLILTDWECKQWQFRSLLLHEDQLCQSD